MMLRLKKLIVIVVACFSYGALFAQEQLFDLKENPQIVQYLKKAGPKLKSGTQKFSDTLELPFFDDFSYQSIFPDTSLWADDYAFINVTFPVNPPSIGVATMDALNNAGRIYNVETPEYFIADKLTSHPINLDYPADSNIYLSFFYQPQGLGNKPESLDSLVLEFTGGGDDWQRVWSAEGTEVKDFKQVILPITDTSFLKKGFQFQFMNYVSINNASSLGSNANSDQWHIDYIYLNKQRNAGDTILNDITLVYPLESSVSGYESIPWDHFVSSNYYYDNTIYLIYSNRDTSIRKASSIVHVTDLLGTFFEDFNMLESNINYNEIVYANRKTEQFNFSDNGLDHGLYEIKGFLEIDEEYDYAGNDTTIYYQQFDDYYAYDDGTAENGYGVNGSNVQLAYKFTTLKEDNLQAIRMHFRHTVDNHTDNKYFYLRVWDDNSGQPGDTIYHQQGRNPDYSDSINGFVTYYLDKELTVSGDFYIGWQQTTDDFLNIGFDLNRDASDNIYYNTNGTWKKTNFEGALMMRPVFGEFIVNNLASINDKPANMLLVFPNPARDEIKIQLENVNEKSIKSYSIFDRSGKLIKADLYNNGNINVSQLVPGIYFIRVISESDFMYNQKFIIAK